MAWIKFDKDMLDDGRLLTAAARLFKTSPDYNSFGAARNGVTGALLRLWIHADTHIQADDVLEMTPDALDAMLDCPGFCAAMPDGWIEENDDGYVRLPGYIEKNGLISKEKRRERDAERARRYRARKRNANDTPPSRVTRHGYNEVDQDQDQDQPNSKRKTLDFESIPNLDPGAWAAWQAYRKAERFRLYKSTYVATKLAKYPAAIQRATVERSISAGWQGLFPDKVQHETSGQGSKAGTYDEHTRRLAEWYLEHTGAVLPGNG